jgi:hypothetical protein
MRNALSPLALVALAFTLSFGCRKKEETTAPEPDFDEGMVAGGSGSRSLSEEEQLDQRYGKRAALGPRPTPEKKCEGKTCTMVDPDPKLSAAHGAREFMAGFRWGMPPDVVLERLGTEIRADYDKRDAKDALAQDKNRKAMEAELEELEGQQVKFGAAGADLWRTTLLANLFREDGNEEMVYHGPAESRRYYLFQGGKLWHVAHGVSIRNWPGKTYDQVVESELKPRFGVSPTIEEERDQKSGMQLLRYHQWETADGDRVRAYDLVEAHGVILISVVEGPGEERLGKRTPTNKLDPALKGGEDLDDVMRESGICYDDKGDMIHDPKRCKEQAEGGGAAPAGGAAAPAGAAKKKRKGK